MKKYKDPKSKKERAIYNQELYEDLREEAIQESCACGNDTMPESDFCEECI